MKQEENLDQEEALKKKIERLNMTKGLWLIVTLYKESEDIWEEIKDDANKDGVIKDTKEAVERIKTALKDMSQKYADIFKKRILSGEAFENVKYGEALELTEEEEKACDLFLLNFYALEKRKYSIKKSVFDLKAFLLSAELTKLYRSIKAKGTG